MLKQKLKYYHHSRLFPVHRQFGAALPRTNTSWVPLVEAKSTAYGNLGPKAFLRPLVAVSS